MTITGLNATFRVHVEPLNLTKIRTTHYAVVAGQNVQHVCKGPLDAPSVSMQVVASTKLQYFRVFLFHITHVVGNRHLLTIMKTLVGVTEALSYYQEHINQFQLTSVESLECANMLIACDYKIVI